MQSLYKWGGLALGLTVVYWLPAWWRSAQRLKDPITYQACATDRYCAPNLLLGPVMWFMASPDTYGYLDPVYAVVQGGPYQPDYRLPGYGIVYGLSYALTGSWKAAFWLLGLGGVLLWAFSQGLWAHAMEEAGHSPWHIAAAILLIDLSPLNLYTRVLVTEAYAASAGLLALYALWRERWGLAGLLTTWAFFLRPVLGIWLLPAGLYAWKQASAKGLLRFLLPFFVLEGAWIARNWRVYGDFRPLTGTRTLLVLGMYVDLTPAVRSLLGALGQDNFMWWNDPTHPYGLLLCKADSPLASWKAAFSALEGSRGCPPESLYHWRTELCSLWHSPTYVIGHRSLQWADDPVPSPTDCRREAVLSQRLTECAEAYKAAHRLWWVRATLYRLYDLRYIPTADRPTSPLRKAYFIAYLGLLAVFLGGALWRLRQKAPFQWAVVGFAWLPILAYLGLGVIERRYVDLQLPFALLAVGFLPRPRQDSNLQPRD